MKKSLLIFSILLICLKANCQNQKARDSVAKAVRERINKLPNSEDDFSNFKNYPKGQALTKKVLDEQKLNSTIVVIDDKIFRLDSKEYLRLTKDSVIEKPIRINDENSPVAIKTIIIFRTKNSLQQ
jgi:hypothetical protein